MVANEWIYKFTGVLLFVCTMYVHEHAKKHESSWLRVFVCCELHDFSGWGFFLSLILALVCVQYLTRQANVLDFAQN